MKDEPTTLSGCLLLSWIAGRGVDCWPSGAASHAMRGEGVCSTFIHLKDKERGCVCVCVERERWRDPNARKSWSWARLEPGTSPQVSLAGGTSSRIGLLCPEASQCAQ